MTCYKYYEENGEYKVIDDNSTFTFSLSDEEEALSLKKELNKLNKRVEYQQRVIEKSIKLDKINNNKIEDYKSEVNILKQENKILRKIINELR